MEYKPKILFADIETSLMLLAGFGLYNQNFSPSNVFQDWHIICASWMFEGDKKVSHAIGNGTNDLNVVKKLIEAIEKADLVVWHNGDKFDLKKLRARAIYHQLPPIAPIPTVDTLKVSRRLFGFTSHRLGYIAQYLGLEEKGKPEPGTWLEVLKGNKKALKEMVPYCDQDVIVLRDVYHRLRPHMTNHPNLSLLDGLHDRGVCRNCGGKHLNKRGTRVTKKSTYQSYQCADCGSWKHGE